MLVGSHHACTDHSYSPLVQSLSSGLAAIVTSHLLPGNLAGLLVVVVDAAAADVVVVVVDVVGFVLVTSFSAQQSWNR